MRPSSWGLVAAAVALAGCCRESMAFRLPSQPPSTLSSRPLPPAAAGRTSTALQGSSLPPDTPSPTGENSRRRQSRFNKTPKQPEEPKKETRFSKDSHFYTGAIGIWHVLVGGSAGWLLLWRCKFEGEREGREGGRDGPSDVMEDWEKELRGVLHRLKPSSLL